MFKLIIKYLIKKIKKEDMQIVDISASELKSLIETDRKNLEMIDVREKNERDIIKIENSKLIPMNQVMSRLDDIDWTKDVVFYCLSGSRSRMLAMLIDKPIKNLKNGIIEVYDEWGEYDVDLVVDKNLIGMYI